MLALGAFALLAHPEQLAALRADPGLVEGAVEEVLRYVGIVNHGLLRTATEDVELGGEVVPAGSLVIVSLATANRDPRSYDRPADFDLSRPRRGNLAFGYGAHQCVGRQVARLELTVGFTELLRRLPGLRLAIPAEEVPVRERLPVYGLHSLPVEWDPTPGRADRGPAP